MLKQKNLFLCVGVPASGKSTWIKRVLPLMERSVCVSRDTIRFAIVDENEDYFSHEEEVFDCFIDRIRECLSLYDNIFIDATHLNEKSRNKVLNRLHLKDNIHIIPIVFHTPLEICFQRNAGREGRKQVPTSVIRRMFYSIKHPLNDKRNYYDIIDVDEYGMSNFEEKYVWK